MLRALSLKSVYDSSQDDLISDLFCPLLAEASVYRRGVGYFTAGWLRLAAAGLVALAEHGGRAYFITSPHLEADDWEAFQHGDAASRDERLHEVLRLQVEDLARTLAQDTRTALAWLVADGVLSFKFAVPKNNIGDFHDKFAIFEDGAGDYVAIHGSFNDSIHGTLNGESFSVFRSWEPGQVEYVTAHLQRFDGLFSESNDFYNMYDMSQAIRDDIVRLRGTEPRPYRLPAGGRTDQVGVPGDLRLYDFQEQAVEAWLAAGGRGLFEMATGTGKTLTSLAAASALQRQQGKLVVVVSAPFNHLVDQWREDVVKFGFTPILCRENADEWVPLARSRIQDYNVGARQSLFFITTHKTSAGARFVELMSRLRGNALLIADEVHYLGASQYRKALLPIFNYRLGLSATPERWFDEEGTRVLRRYFGDTVAEMPLERAIGRFLTPYRFIPHSVALNEWEMEQFASLSIKIGQLMVHRDERAENKPLEALLRRRAALIAKAEEKFPTFARLIKDKVATEGAAQLSHTIVYVAPGQTAEAVRLLASLGLRAHEFVYWVSTEERTKLLRQFDAGDIQVLVAIKCLDEGVNIPATHEAYFLASTSNPREFVQRRGRILRKHPGKTEAILHDLVVVPPLRPYGVRADVLEGERVLLRKEMPRFAEFASAALNEMEARSVLFPLLQRYDLLTLFDKKPWDVYRENQGWGDYSDAAHS